jgi:hypothetical protein
MRRSATHITLCLILCLFFQVSCTQSQVPQFDGEAAYEYLRKQCDFGPRAPGSTGHDRCLEFLFDELKKFTDTVVKQPFLFTNHRDQTRFTLHNVVASFGSQGDRILLCAHWDTRPWADRDPDRKNRKKPILGANDGASGVAVLLQVARILAENPPPVGIDIVLFDGEDSGLEGQDETWCQGSRYFAQNKQPGYFPRYGILLDFVGDKDLHFPVEVNSYEYAPEIVDLVWTKAEELGLHPFDRAMGYQIIDDHLELLKVGIPAVNIIDFDYPYYHTLEDTEDKCSPESLGIVGTLLLHLIYD